MERSKNVEVADYYTGNKSSHRLLDITNTVLAASFLVPGIFWDAVMISAVLLGVQAIAAVYIYAANLRMDVLRGEAIFELNRGGNSGFLSTSNYIEHHMLRNRKRYGVHQLIPTALFNKEFRANKKVRKTDNSGTSVITETVVKRRNIQSVETVNYSTLALWDKARKNALKMP